MTITLKNKITNDLMTIRNVVMFQNREKFMLCDNKIFLKSEFELISAEE